MKCGVPDCPHPARGRYTPRDGGPSYRTDEDPLCPEHALLSSIRSHASLVRAETLCGADALRRADNAYRRAVSIGLVVPDPEIPRFARVEPTPTPARRERGRRAAEPG